ncbi:hypothetical protein [Candidatus Sororendozoicomonas aggregata]|uniref:hypothetical protein n=1 Tax=Candidatus Sororendozoicomonas aggregata TaxID=3073239 RepID=UPI002ED66E4C
MGVRITDSAHYRDTFIHAKTGLACMRYGLPMNNSASLTLFDETESLSLTKVSAKGNVPDLLPCAEALTISGSQCFSGSVNC